MHHAFRDVRFSHHPMTSAVPSPVLPRARFAPDPVLIITGCALALLALGLAILFSASAALRQGPFFYLNKQVEGAVMAAAVAWWVSSRDLERWRGRVWWIGGGAVLLLLLVALPGIGSKVNGSRRWLAGIQVSEFAKVALVFCLAHYLAVNQTHVRGLKRGLVWPLAIIGAFAGPLVFEPDYGMAALFVGIGLVLMFLAGVRLRHLWAATPLLAAGLALIVLQDPNRRERLREYFGGQPAVPGALAGVQPAKPKRTQLDEAQAAFTVGGIEGVGLGQGRQQLSYLPEAHTDFIFSVVGEELGLRFTLAVVALFGIMFVAGLMHLRRAPNLFQFLLVAGALAFITTQALINFFMVTGLIPPKGISLPFISAGRSNLLVMGLLVGLMLNTRRAWPRPGLDGGRRAWLEVPPDAPVEAAP